MSALADTLLIARRELDALFLSPVAWVVLTAVTFLNGFGFASLLLVPGLAEVPAHVVQGFLFTSIFFWLSLLVALPLIGMRLLAEERQSGTIEALLTAPVTENRVVAGKFLAGLAFYVVLLLPFALYLFALDLLGETDLRAAASGLFGMLVVGAFLLALCLVASAIAQTQIAAGLVGFVLVALAFLAPLLAAEPLRASALAPAIEHVDLYAALDDFSRGLVDTRRLAYPLGGTFFALFLSARLLEATRGR